MGYISADASEFGVAIRSALVSATWTSSDGLSRSRRGNAASGNATGFVGTAGRGGGRGRGGGVGGSEMTLFAGAGIVPGSVALSEWAETGVKVRGWVFVWVGGRECEEKKREPKKFESLCCRSTLHEIEFRPRVG